ncbi:MAG: AbiV family abortive infection protein [Deltaproteobacteria bacterium]|nr:AbiV family abortive infection protein [Deltaproteobacteria bacterium]
MNAAMTNARRLLKDAKRLLEGGSYPTAATLAVLSIEESGKTAILRELAVAKDAKEIGQLWKRYRSHTQKNVAWILPQLVAQGARHLEDFRSLFDAGADHTQLLDSLKQLGLYTDCLGRAHWSEPEKVVDDKLARQLVQVADVLSRSREITVREIELWIKHLKPVWRGPMDWMKKAVANWYADMQREGLVQTAADEMESFLYGRKFTGPGRGSGV